jgi:uncharacterized protein (TIGR00375 family)
MRVIADLHIHSRFSRATSPRLTLPHLDRWARIKGINLVGCGDCTHPTWLSEIQEQLDEAEQGFFTLKEAVRRAFDAETALAEELSKPRDAQAMPRFTLTGEISTIYKQGDKTRKVHHVVILPDFRAAARFQTALERCGNITSDGRPILGIDSRELLSLLLEADERALLIPAHIWTPWFSAMGAKSGFDSIDECYGDLAPHICAIETGLSSNPPMNWAVRSLDRFSIISNSDAHSPQKLGREATVFEMEMSFPALIEALHTDSRGGRVSATIEFFPQEGKYHYAGHRKCGVFIAPEENGEGLCPVCGKRVTAGVMNRVMELADGVVDETAPCPPPPDTVGSNRRPYYSLIPLREILGELLDTGASSKKVDAAYNWLIENAGTELSLLMDNPLADLETLQCPDVSGELLAVALGRMREGQVSIKPGYDGEYGVIRAFPPRKSDEAEFFDIPPKQNTPTKTKRRAIVKTHLMPVENMVEKIEKKAFVLSAEQEQAVLYEGSHALIIAGPGSGKTATLAACIARLLPRNAAPTEGEGGGILALSFTVKAAFELRERILKTAGDTGADTAGITTATFHSFCAALLREHYEAALIPADFKILNDTERDSLLRELCIGAGRVRGEGLGKYIENRKRFLLVPGEDTLFAGACADDVTATLIHLADEWGLPPVKPDEERLYGAYRECLRSGGGLDFDDLVSDAARLLAHNPAVLAQCRARFRAIFVDEYQDVNFAQYALIRLLVPGGQSGRKLWVIGDPNQAIYAFRGSDKRFIDRFLTDYPDAAYFHLSESFRCAAPIINAAVHLVTETAATDSALLRGAPRTAQLFRAEYPTEKSEAEGIARRLARLMGGTTFFAIDSGVVTDSDLAADGEAYVDPDECVILLRTLSLAPPFAKALMDHGIPFRLGNEKPWWEEEPVNSLIAFLRDNAAAPLSPAEYIQAAWKKLAADKAIKIRRGINAEAAVERLIALSRFFDTLPAFLAMLLVKNTPPGGEAPERGGVAIMTMHASKGLEFDHVFVAGLEEGLMPFTLYETETLTAERLNEEKRLLYVAMTRARHGLYFSYAKKRTLQGKALEREKSRFFDNIDSFIPQLSLPERRKPREAQLSLF